MSWSEKLRKAMDKSSKSLYQIAKEAKVPYAVVHRFYNGKRTIRLKTLEKLLPVLGLQVVSVETDEEIQAWAEKQAAAIAAKG